MSQMPFFFSFLDVYCRLLSNDTRILCVEIYIYIYIYMSRAESQWCMRITSQRHVLCLMIFDTFSIFFTAVDSHQNGKNSLRK